MKLEIFNSHLVTNHPKSNLDIYNRLSIKGKYEVTILSFATKPSLLPCILSRKPGRIADNSWST